MIAEGIDLSPMQLLSSGNLQAIIVLLERRSHGAKIRRDCRNTVRFLYSQFAPIPNFDPVNGIRRNGSQYGNFVNQHLGLRAANGRTAQFGALDLDVAYKLSVVFFNLRKRSSHAHADQQIQKIAARWIEAQAAQD